MYSMLIRALLFILGIYLIRRLIAAFSGAARQGSTGGASKKPSKNMVKDPVCGMYMDPRLAIRLETRGDTFYFCSENCRKKFSKPGYRA